MRQHAASFSSAPCPILPLPKQLLGEDQLSNAPYKNCAMKGGICDTPHMCERFGQCLEAIDYSFHRGFASGYETGHSAAQEQVNADHFKAGVNEGFAHGQLQGRHEGRVEAQKEFPARIIAIIEEMEEEAEARANFLSELQIELRGKYPSK